MTSDFIGLQVRADLLATKLAGDDRALVFELCRELRDRQARIDRVKWATE